MIWLFIFLNLSSKLINKKQIRDPFFEVRTFNNYLNFLVDRKGRRDQEVVGRAEQPDERVPDPDGHEGCSGHGDSCLQTSPRVGGG